MAIESNPIEDANMFRPPLARGMQILDRSVFQKTLQLKAARVFDNKNISKIRGQLERSKDALQLDRLPNVYSDPDAERAKMGKKCILLRPEFRDRETGPEAVANGESRDHDDEPTIPWPHSSTVSGLVKQDLISLVSYPFHLPYSYWTYHEIISSILPLDAQTEIPVGFSQVGHVLHMNLRAAFLTYKHLIASILYDKNHGVRTIINKIDDVGEENEFRTFKYEILAGEDDLNVVVSEAGCEFRFNYAKVYWNPRLGTEHARLVGMFKEGEAVCDVMAGVGPFAVPAGKKGVFVWANDLNPDSWEGLREAVVRNKVGEYVRPFNEDGRTFIRDAAASLLEEDKVVEIKKKVSRTEAKAQGKQQEDIVLKRVVQPKTFQHYVLNLPASALTFLPSLIGLYPPSLRGKLPPNTLMPIVHAYCFSTKDEFDTNEASESDIVSPDASGKAQSAEEKICAQVSTQLEYPMYPGKIDSGGPRGVGDMGCEGCGAQKKDVLCKFSVTRGGRVSGAGLKSGRGVARTRDGRMCIAATNGRPCNR